jgi:hypothetical protein
MSLMAACAVEARPWLAAGAKAAAEATREARMAVFIMVN